MNISFCAEKYKQALTSVDDITVCPKVPLPQINDHQNYIFISYSHKDFKRVYADLADMYEAKVRFWYDSGLSAGKKWDEEVREKILDPRCAGVIFYISENLFLSQSANHEIEVTHQCAAGSEKRSKNYFCVNLTNKLPIAILSDAIRNDTDRRLDMHQISILSQAFPDNATYIHYAAPDHKEQLISQIQNRFGVIDASEEYDPFRIDATECSIYISSFESMQRRGRQKLLRDLRSNLKEKGISVYIGYHSQENSGSTSLDTLFNEHIERQNSVKLETAKNILILSSALGWGVASNYFGEFDSNVSVSKNILYLIDDTYMDPEKFAHFYHIDTEKPDGESIMQRVFFLNDPDYPEKIALISLKTAE